MKKIVSEVSTARKMNLLVASLRELGYKQINSGYEYSFALRGGFTLDIDPEALFVNKESAGFHAVIDWRDVSPSTIDIRNSGKMSIFLGRNGTEISFY